MYTMFRSFSLVGLMAFAATANAQQLHDHADHGHDLHFVHPLVAESISPDTKVRLNYEYLDPAAEHELELEGEYAFSRAFSVEVGVHFHPQDTALGDTHVRLKGASYVLQESGVLLGYGVSVNIPTGSSNGHESEHADDEHGDDEHAEERAGDEHGGDEHGGDEHAEEHGGFSVGPFLNAGVQVGRAEIVGWATFDFSLEDEETEGEGSAEGDSQLAYSLSTLYHVTPSLEVLLELDGQVPLESDTNRSVQAYITPGVKVQPFSNSGLAVGVGVSFPLTTARAFDLGVLASVFYHF